MTDKLSIHRRLATRCCGSILLGIGLAAAIGFALTFYGGSDEVDADTPQSASLFPDSDARMQDVTRALLAEQGVVLDAVEPAAGQNPKQSP